LYAYEVGELLQEPVEEESACPRVVVPEMIGRTVFAGGRPETTTV
jgi:hypothetical protein